MKRLNTLTRACRPIAPNPRFSSLRALSTSPSKALLLHTSTKSPLRITSSFSTLQSTRRHASTTTDTQSLRKTPLYDFHIANGAKMVPFAGFHMPVQYSSLSVAESHNFTRTHCSIFDVSHMVQHKIQGYGAAAFLEQITPISISELRENTASLSTLLLPETGGILDDTIITKLGPDSFYVVTNAGCRDKDLLYLTEHLLDVTREIWEGEKESPGESSYQFSGEVSNDKGNEKREFSAVWNGKALRWEIILDKALIAMQGPLAAEILSSVLDEPTKSELKEMYFGSCKTMKIRLPNGGVSSPLLVSRAGYTGEDGFELSIPESEVVAVTQALLDAGGKDRIALAGLGARDSLRLEAGMCLYGHDLDETVTPVEASLSWIIGKSRKETGGFYGDKVILSQLKPISKGGEGVTRRRVGIIVDGAPAREGAEIFAPVGKVDGDAEGEKIGVVTSGCPSPTLKKNISMGYVRDGFHKAGTEVDVLVRGKKRRGVITKMPFVPAKYYKSP